MRNFFFIATVATVILFGFVCGYYIYKGNLKEKTNNEEYNLGVLENSKNNIQNDEKLKNEIVETNASDEKISPNATLVIKKYYKDCGHTTKDYSEIPEEMVNMSEDDLAKKLQGWEIKGFSSNEIVIYKEIDGICDEHYILRNKDGNIAIFRIDSNDKEVLSQMTEISTEYLTENDLAKLEQGIKAVGKEELNSILEDYE